MPASSEAIRLIGALWGRDFSAVGFGAVFPAKNAGSVGLSTHL